MKLNVLEKINFKKFQYQVAGQSNSPKILRFMHVDPEKSEDFCQNRKTNHRTFSKSNIKQFTINEAIEHFGFGIFQMKVALITGLSFMSDGVGMMVLSILTSALSCDWAISKKESELLKIVVFIGWALGGVIWGQFADKFGRKKGMIISTCVSFYFGILSSFAPNLEWLIALRALVGFGIGGSSIAFTLFCEYSPVKLRSRVLLWLLLFWPLGSAFQVGVSILVVPTFGWRCLLILSALPSLVSIISCFWLNESPRFHLVSGRPEEAYKTLEKIAQVNNFRMPDGKLVNIPKEQVKTGLIIGLFVKKNAFHTIILWLIWFSNSFMYFGLILLTHEIFYYGNVSKVASDFDINHQKCNLKCLEIPDYYKYFYRSLAEFIAVTISVVLMDILNIERKKMMVISYLLFSLFTFGLNIISKRNFLVGSFIIIRCCIQILIQTTFVITPEHYPTSIRQIGIGTCNAIARLAAVTAPFAVYGLLEINSYVAVNFFGGLALATAILPCFLNETKRRELKDF